MDDLQCTEAMSTSNSKNGSSCLDSMTGVYSKIEKGYFVTDLELENRQDMDQMPSAMYKPESSDKFKIMYSMGFLVLVLVLVLGLMSITTRQVSLQELIGNFVFDTYAETLIFGVF